MLASAFLLVASADTVWWNSTAGTVVGHRDGDATTCTMTLQGDDMQVRFAWSANLPPRAVVERRDWHFPPGGMLDIAVQIGDVWLGDRNGVPNLPSMTGPSAVMFIANGEVDRLILGTRRIRVVTASSAFDMTLEPARTRPLLAALDRCRALIR